jgi:hypothetical protein
MNLENELFDTFATIVHQDYPTQIESIVLGNPSSTNSQPYPMASILPLHWLTSVSVLLVLTS